MRDIRILATGGGTGGHISPAIAVIQTVRHMAIGQDWQPIFLYVGGARSLEERLAAEIGVDFRGVRSGKLRRARSLLMMLNRQNAKDMLRVPLGIKDSLAAVRAFRPDVVLATGGYVSVPPVIAAGMLRIPALIHEQTVQVGLANKIAARFAARIALSYEESKDCLPPRSRDKAVVTGNPIRDIVLHGNKDSARRRWDLLKTEPDLPVIYVTGGAQGAHPINALVETALPDLLREAIVIHQSGAADYEHFEQLALRLPKELTPHYRVTSFIDEGIGDLYALADIIVGRSGAGTVAEAAAVGKPALYMPLVPTGGDEQTRNAQRAASAGAALVLTQETATAESLLAALQPLVRDASLRGKMGAAAQTLARPEAAQELASILLELAGLNAANRLVVSDQMTSKAP